VYYGHPGVFVAPSHLAISLARKEGFTATMKPFISALDCIFADLGIDPCTGFQMLEATDLVLRKRWLDTYSHVVIFQIGSIGNLKFSFKGLDRGKMEVLAAYLAKFYPLDHVVTLYEAPQFSICDPVIEEIRIDALHSKKLSGISSLYVPPLGRPPVYFGMLEELDLMEAIKALEFVPL
jgi:uncharacterized protein YabN with tetrapyrrole methylase and pyrophosphatase domain